MAQLTHAFQKNLPEFKVIVARTISEAQMLVAEFPIFLYILDIHLPDGSGIDFLCDIQTISPDSRVIMMTAVPLPEYRNRAETLGVIRFLEKPVDPQALCALVREYGNQAKAPAAAADPAPAPEAFTGALSALTMIDIIQLKCLGRTTQAIEFTRPDHRSGRIYFRLGEVIHAETEKLAGVDAFNEVVSWRGGKLRELPDETQPARSIAADWQSLLLAAVQRMDELQHNPAV